MPPYSGAFLLANQRGIVCFSKNIRFDPPNVIEILKLLREAKKQDVQILTNGGLESCGMMRGFQIWSQNLNLISFDPFLAKNWQNTQFCHSYIFWPKRGSNVTRFKF